MAVNPLSPVQGGLGGLPLLGAKDERVVGPAVAIADSNAGGLCVGQK